MATPSTRVRSGTGRRVGVAIGGVGALCSYPKDVAKRDAIIDAARRLFASQPFDLVTMETIAKLAGVSKMTVYSHFRDKETLFETIVLATSDQMISSLSAPDQVRGLRERLLAVGTIVLSVILGSDICTMAHTLPAAVRANRELA